MHTKGKWIARPNRGVNLGSDNPKYVVGTDVLWVALVDSESDAQRIATAVNAFDDMYEALKNIRERREHPCLGEVCRLFAGEPSNRCSTEGFISGCSYGLKARLQAIDKALSKAEGR